jgi:hypothetical protein
VTLSKSQSRWIFSAPLSLSGENRMQTRPNIVMVMIGERLMVLPRLGFIVGATLAVAVGCSGGAPDRASDIQNVNAISDDISAVGMTQSDSLKIPDPNLATTFPHSYQLPPD